MYVSMLRHYFLTFSVKVGEFNPRTSLNEYIRKSLYLTGTKEMCREGGCGVCIVTATAKHPVTKKFVTFTVNSVRKNYLFTVDNFLFIFHVVCMFFFILFSSGG